MSVHKAARDGFNPDASRYAKGRPEYPAEAVAAWLTRDLGLGPGKLAVDLGAGTGKFTKRLVASGAEVIAVEPARAMRDTLRESNPTVDVRDGTAEAMPIDDESVDAVVCAQAFHWFASPEAVAEVRRVLKPGGVFGLIWNMRDDRVAWVARLTEIMQPYEGGAPRVQHGTWREQFPAKGFGPLNEREVPHVHTGPADAVIVDRTLSVSFIAALADDERERVASAVRAMIAETPDLAGKDEVSFPYVTRAYSCMKTD